MTRIAKYTAALAVVLLATVAYAQQPTPAKVPDPDLPPDLVQKFKQADITNRGGLNKAEAASAGFAKGQFDDVDADHDHIITLYEISTYVAKSAKAWASADTNGDGVVRKEEYEAFSETTLYQNVDLPYVVPNIFNKKF